MKAVSVKRPQMQEWMDKESKAGSAIRSFAEWKRKADEKAV
jgi:hypothetical protein